MVGLFFLNNIDIYHIFLNLCIKATTTIIHQNHIISNFILKSKNISDQNYSYAIISITMVLLLFGFFGLVLIYTKSITTSFQENIDIIIELKNEIGKESQSIIKNLQKSSFIKPNSVKFIDKDIAFKQLKEQLGDDLVQYDINNPLYDIIKFNVLADYMTPEKIKSIKQNLLKNANIRDVYYQETFLDTLMKNIQKIAWVSLFIGFIGLIVAIALIHNTFKLAFFEKRFLIKNMQLVGADDQFISRPFVMQSLYNGLISSIISIFLLAVLVVYIQKGFFNQYNETDFLSIGLLFLGLTMIGVVISTVSTYVIIKKFLIKDVDEMY